MSAEAWQAWLALGLDGVEARFPSARRPRQEWLQRFAIEHRLLTTAGDRRMSRPAADRLPSSMMRTKIAMSSVSGTRRLSAIS